MINPDRGFPTRSSRYRFDWHENDLRRTATLSPASVVAYRAHNLALIGSAKSAYPSALGPNQIPGFVATHRFSDFLKIRPISSSRLGPAHQDRALCPFLDTSAST